MLQNYTKKKIFTNGASPAVIVGMDEEAPFGKAKIKSDTEMSLLNIPQYSFVRGE